MPLKFVLSSVFTLLILATLSACGGAAPVTPGGGVGTLQSIAIAPVNSSLGIGATQTFVATGSYTDGSTQNLSSQVAWASTVPIVARINASTGVATSLAPGATTISATFGGATYSTQLNVINKTLQSIAVTPANISLGVGATQGFVAIGTYSDASTQNFSSSVTWASSLPAVASINAAGVVSALTAGTSSISAAMGVLTGSTPLTITAKTLQSIAVTPSAFSIAAGTTQQLVATGTYSDSSTQVITNSVSWTTANAAVATVGAATGLVTGAVAGTGVAITATSGVVTGASRGDVTVAGVTLTGLTVAASTQFIGPTFRPFPQVCAQFSNGIGSCPYFNVTWTSSNTAVAIVSDTQGVKALTAGVTTLTARSGSITASNTLTVNAPVLDAIAVLPAAPTIAAGTQLQMTAMGTYSDGSQQDITTLTGLIWTSATPGAVSVNTTGMARGVAAGSSLLSASAAGRTGSTTATVPAIAPPPPTTVILYPVNDNTIASSSLSLVPETTVHQFNYWFSSPGIGMGCNHLYGVITNIQNISCARGLIKFNLAALAGKTIQSATLSLTTSAHGVGRYPDQWYLAASASPWAGSTVTWRNYGDLTYTASIGYQNPPTFVGQIFSLDQTATVRNWVSGAYVNNGFAMALTREQLRFCACDSFDLFEFHSNEDPSGRGPKLTVTYQ